MAAERRAAILETLRQEAPVSGQELARRLSVSRQVIVQDVALLRAAGEPIISTPRGYVYWVQPEGVIRSVLAVRHPNEAQAVRTELRALVDAGVRVVNVIIEHPLYGELVGNLDLASPEAVETFMAASQEHGAPLLSSLTDGVHLHTVEGPREAVDRARQALDRIGMLLRAR